MSPAAAMRLKLETGSQRKGVTAEEVFRELDSIRKENNGRLTPHDVVEAAKPAKSILHKYFTWDDNYAAYEYRLQEARKLIQNVKVRFDSAPETRAFVHVRVGNDSKPTYTRTDVAFKNVSMREQVVEQAYKELMKWRKKFANVEELAEIFAALDPLIEYDEEEAETQAVGA